MVEEITYESLLEGMLQRALQADPNLDTREGSVLWLALAPAAAELQNAYLQLDNILTECFADTASREYLARRAAERGVVPYSATPAILELTVTPAAVQLDAATRFSVGALNYQVTDDLGDGKWELTCETAGEEGNRYGSTAILLDYVEGLEGCRVTALLVPGRDEEDTEIFRERYFDSISAQAFGGNRADYLSHVNAMPGVGGAKVYRAWNGDLTPAGLIPPEGTAAWIAQQTGAPEAVKTWLETVCAAGTERKLTTGGSVKLVIIDSTYAVPSQALVSQVQTALDPQQNAGEGVGIAPMGHVVLVEGVMAQTVDLSFALYYQRDWTWDDVSGYVETAVKNYFLELAKSWADQEEALVVRISQLESRILAIDGILDIANTRIGGEPSNLTLEADHIPVLGTISASTITVG